MRKLALGLATAVALVATPAMARNGAVYVGAELGGLKANDTNIDVGTVSDAVNVNYRFDFPDHMGYDAAAFIGYDFGGFRLEAEYAKKRAPIESVNTLVNLPGGTRPGLYSANGHTDATSYMLNGMLDLGNDEGTSFFAGGGVGYASTQLAGLQVYSNAAPYLQDTDSGFAWQLFAGLRQAITPNVDVHVKYRYFNAGSVTYDDGIRTGNADFSSHSVLGGISFNFGGVAPAPVVVPAPVVEAAPPPPPPPPPPPQTMTCPDGTVVSMGASCPVPPPPVVPRAGERG